MSADAHEHVFQLDDVSVLYGTHAAVSKVDLAVHARQITAFIGPSGCGKTSILRSLNRMNDLVPGARVEGLVSYRGTDVYGDGVDANDLRRRVGMVFQKPNVFPSSIYDNVAYGPRLHRMKGSLDDRVEAALVKAALWDEVRTDLHQDAHRLSGGQQQRLVIARCLAVDPDVILMDEPCASLDPIATERIEELMLDLAAEYSIVIVTHNLQQAVRVSDMTAFFTADYAEDGTRHGRLVEYASTEQLFNAPADPITRDYIEGRFG